MNKLAELRKALGEALDALETLAEAGGDEYDAKKLEVEQIEKSIERLMEAQERKSKSLQPVGNPTGLGTAPAAVEPQVKTPVSNIGRFAIAMIAAKGDPARAADFSQKTWGSSGDVLTKNLLASVGTAGGILVPQAFSQELIELLRPASVVMQSQPRMLQMPNGNMTLPGVASGSTANYVGEAQPAPPSSMTFRGVVLVAKKIVSIVPVSNDMIRYVNASTEAFVRDDMVSGIATTVDQTLIRGQGSQFAPKGLRGWAGEVAATNVISANATVNLVNVTNDLGRMELALLNANIPMVRPTWFFSPRTMIFLQNLRDGNGNYVFPEIPLGRLRGKPYKVTTSIPDTLAADAGAATGSEIYLTEFNEFIVGESLGLEVEVANGAAYFDGTNTVSGFSQDQTVLKALTAHDTAMRQPAAAVLMQNVRWIP